MVSFFTFLSLCYIKVSIKHFYFIFHMNHCFPLHSPPPSQPSFTPHPISIQIGVGSPLGINKAWHVKLRNYQAPHLCFKTEQAIPPQGIGSKEPTNASGTSPGPTVRSHTNDTTDTQMQRA